MNIQLRKSFTQFLLCTAPLIFCSSSSSAESTLPAPNFQQVPGFYRSKVGNIEVTALYDGYVDLGNTLLKGISSKTLQSLLTKMFIYHDKGTQTAVNAYLIHTGNHLTLIDTGAAECFGKTLGAIRSNLVASGYRLEQVQSVLLTHLHPDHACGLVNADGSASFPNATVYVSKPEAAFWLSDAVADRAPNEAKGFFKMAKASVKPYQDNNKFQTFEIPSGKSSSALPIPNIEAVATYGHTPGHVSYRVRSETKSLLVIGDIVHSYAVQFERPEVTIEFDADAKSALATRRAIFTDAAKQGYPIAGAHLPFPGIGYVRSQGKSFAWVPAEFSPVRMDR